jgi:hypothetical protein
MAQDLSAKSETRLQEWLALELIVATYGTWASFLSVFSGQWQRHQEIGHRKGMRMVFPQNPVPA